MTAATRSDVLDALRDAMQRSPHGEAGDTGPELRAALGGMGQVKFKTYLMPLIQSGQVTVVTVIRQTMAGRTATVPGYRFTAKKK
jgi:hypothetical protein